MVHALPGVLGFSIADLGEPGRVPPNTARGEDEHAPRRVCSSRAHLALAVPRAPGTAASGGPASGGTASTLEPEDGPPRDCLAGGDARRGTQGRLAAPAGPRGRSGALTQRGRASTQTSASDGRRAVDAWLQGLGLGKFVPIFAQHGLDSLTLVAELKDADAVSLVQPANVDNLGRYREMPPCPLPPSLPPSTRPLSRHACITPSSHPNPCPLRLRVRVCIQALPQPLALAHTTPHAMRSRAPEHDALC